MRSLLKMPFLNLKVDNISIGIHSIVKHTLKLNQSTKGVQIMDKYSEEVKKAAMAKMDFAAQKSQMVKQLTENKRRVAELRKSHSHIKSNAAKFVVYSKAYYDVFTMLENVISRITKTNLKQSIKEIINKIINQYVPSDLRYRFTSIKRDLEKLLKSSDVDVSKVKNVILDAAKKKIYNDILDEAEKIYKRTFFNTGHAHIKHAYSRNEIAKWLRNRNSNKNFKLFMDKLALVDSAIKKFEKVVNLTDHAIKVFDYYSSGNALLQQQSQMKTAREYKDYYYNVALEASKFAADLKNFSSCLPIGMRDYFEYIFTVAEQTGAMAKVVYGYVTRWDVEMANIDKEIKKNNPFGSNGPTFMNQYRINNRKCGNPNDDNVGMFFGND